MGVLVRILVDNGGQNMSGNWEPTTLEKRYYGHRALYGLFGARANDERVTDIPSEAYPKFVGVKMMNAIKKLGLVMQEMDTLVKIAKMGYKLSNGRQFSIEHYPPFDFKMLFDRLIPVPYDDSTRPTYDQYWEIRNFYSPQTREASDRSYWCYWYDLLAPLRGDPDVYLDPRGLTYMLDARTVLRQEKLMYDWGYFIDCEYNWKSPDFILYAGNSYGHNFYSKYLDKKLNNKIDKTPTIGRDLIKKPGNRPVFEGLKPVWAYSFDEVMNMNIDTMQKEMSAFHEMFVDKDIYDHEIFSMRPFSEIEEERELERKRQESCMGCDTPMR